MQGKYEQSENKGEMGSNFLRTQRADIQWMLDRFISKEVIVKIHRQIVLPLPGIRGIRPYAAFRVL